MHLSFLILLWPPNPPCITYAMHAITSRKRGFIMHCIVHTYTVHGAWLRPTENARCIVLFVVVVDVAAFCRCNGKHEHAHSLFARAS